MYVVAVLEAAGIVWSITKKSRGGYAILAIIVQNKVYFINVQDKILRVDPVGRFCDRQLQDLDVGLQKR